MQGLLQPEYVVAFMLFALSVFTRMHFDLGRTLLPPLAPHSFLDTKNGGVSDEERETIREQKRAKRRVRPERWRHVPVFSISPSGEAKYFASPYCPSFLEDWTAAVFLSQSTAATAAAPGGIAGRLYRRGRGRKRRQKAEEGNN